MEFDRIVSQKQEQKFAAWLKLFLSKTPEILSMQIAYQHRPGNPRSACRWKSGAFNICYRVRYEDGFHLVVRFSALGKAILRQEKARQEVAVMNYLRQNTSIPVPEVLGSGTCWSGPYIVMPFVEGVPLSELLKDHSKEGSPVLNAQLSDRSLKRAYREMAILVLELSKPEFHTIGALEESEEGFNVTGRPLTFNMNELMLSANIHESNFPTRTFTTATDYFKSLALEQISHLRLQKNNAVKDEDDCRKKFAARYLFQKVVSDVSTNLDKGPFKLYCDDFRPSNVLIDVEKFCVSGAIDWEFTYVAPAEFSHVAPWWLLLISPEGWESDLNQFLDRYTPCFRLFLEALKESEDKMIEQQTLSEGQRLSPRMEHSMETGLFWVCLAARRSSMFDEIYWTFIDKKYFGPFTSLDDRIRLLSEEQREEMNELVRFKTSQLIEDNGEDFNDHYPIEDLLLI
ncbi:hypothetical protein MferCBS31731_006070 [Microsporum ferrugineum]